jgi:hypothetical protein
MSTEPQTPHPGPDDRDEALEATTFGECPECGLPAEVVTRFVVSGDDAPIECAAVRCIAGHHFRCPVELLERSKLTCRAGHDHATTWSAPGSPREWPPHDPRSGQPWPTRSVPVAKDPDACHTPAPWRSDAACRQRPNDARAAGSAPSNAPAPLSDEDWDILERRFLWERPGLSPREEDLRLFGWTAPRAWWETDS